MDAEEMPRGGQRPPTYDDIEAIVHEKTSGADDFVFVLNISHMELKRIRKQLRVELRRDTGKSLPEDQTSVVSGEIDVFLKAGEKAMVWQLPGTVKVNSRYNSSAWTMLMTLYPFRSDPNDPNVTVEPDCTFSPWPNNFQRSLLASRLIALEVTRMKNTRYLRLAEEEHLFAERIHITPATNT